VTGRRLLSPFSTGIPDVPLPFGSDRKLLAWVFDRAINSESPMIAWESAWEYQKETGLKRSGKNNKDLRERFHRIISGLNINIERKDASGIAGKNFSIIDTYNLPPSISGQKFNPDQRSLGYTTEEAPELPPAPFGIKTLFHDIRKHHVAVPRSLWLQAKGNSQVQDMVPWLYYRCYAAKTESVIPWSALAGQFSQDKNPRRARQHAREAIAQLRLLWPGVRVEATATVIRRLRPSCSTTLRKAVCGASARESPYYGELLRASAWGDCDHRGDIDPLRVISGIGTLTIDISRCPEMEHGERPCTSFDR